MDIISAWYLILTLGLLMMKLILFWGQVGESVLPVLLLRHLSSSWKCDVLTTVLPGKFLLPVSNVSVESS